MSGRLIWIDLEMTGLDPEKGVILEIATIVTNDNLDILAEGPNIAIRHPHKVLEKMDAWSMTHHKESGLWDRVKASSDDTQSTEQKTLAFLSKHCKRGEPLMCGNSVWQDRRFLTRHMPDLEAFFHYRMIDVSSIKELVRRWYPFLPAYKKKNTHLALSDVKESINELKYYRQKVFLP